MFSEANDNRAAQYCDTVKRKQKSKKMGKTQKSRVFYKNS